MEKPRKGSKAGVPAIYEDSFKILVAREYLMGNLSYSQLARKHNLPNEDSPRYFVRWYHKWLENRDLNDSQGILVEGSNKSKDLEQRLFDANLKITALEMLIQEAEDKLGIDIGKKSGSKSSTR